jgi:cysteine-rich repeat protein
MHDERSRRWVAAWMSALALALAGSCGDDSGATSETEATSSTGAASGSGGSADETGDPSDPCGNGAIDGFEACDDGNRTNGDGCNADCTPSGQVRWTSTFDGGAGFDCAEGVAADGEGNVIVAGFVSTAMTGEDLWIRKHDLEGNELWTSSLDHAFGDDRYRAVAVSEDGSIYAVGFVTADLPSQGRNILVRKLGPTGVEQWTQSHDNPFDQSADQAFAVVATADGSVVVAGEEVVAQQDSDVWVRKYDADGVEQWTMSHAGAAEALDSARGVAELPGGDLVVSGWETQADGGRAIWVRRLSSTGDEVWTQTFNAGAPNGNIGNAVAARSDDTVVATGSQRVGSEDPDLWVAGYDPDGAELWAQAFDGPGSGSDAGRGVAADDDDAAVVVGTVITGGGVPNLRVTRLTPEGVVLGSTDYGGVNVLGSEGYAVAIAPDQDVVFAGCEYDPADVSTGNIMVAKVGP